jgi:ubiquinone/menaquinone biosynthesis C-methylase UbiE
MVLDKKKKKEILHGQNIQHRAEFVWGWATDAGKLRASRRAELLFKFGNLSASEIVLEIGCGTGVFTQRLLKKGIQRFIAVDISLDLLKKARDSIGNPNVKFIVADVENLPFKDNTFDSAVGVSILHHLDFEIAIKEISRILKQNGRIAFSEPNMFNPQVFLMKNVPFIKKALGEVEGERAFLKSSIKRQLELANFKNVIVRPFDFLHPCVHRNLINFISSIGANIEKLPIIKEIAGSLIIYGEINKG